VKFDENLFITNYFGSSNKEKLKNKKITHILIVAKELEIKFKDVKTLNSNNKGFYL
jgi:hypothetical protein